MMKLFISFAGPQSKAVATALHDWIPKLFPSITTWISSEDIDKGRRWRIELSAILQESNLGIICLTKNNLESTWIHFEAGALAKTVEDSYLWTYLHDVKPSEIKDPLGQFQHTIANKEDTKKLLRTIHSVLLSRKEEVIDEKEFDKRFEELWPELEETLSKIPVEENSREEYSGDTAIQEILIAVRSLAIVQDQRLVNVLNEAKRFALEAAKREATDPNNMAQILRHM
jgi:hypothetical protein